MCLNLFLFLNPVSVGELSRPSWLLILFKYRMHPRGRDTPHCPLQCSGKQGLYGRPDALFRRFPGHWPNFGAEALAVAEAPPRTLISFV